MSSILMTLSDFCNGDFDRNAKDHLRARAGSAPNFAASADFSETLPHVNQAISRARSERIHGWSFADVGIESTAFVVDAQAKPSRVYDNGDADFGGF
jgi:hypothetical protein